MKSGDFELHHWRTPTRPKSIIIPNSIDSDLLLSPSYKANGNRNGYTSLSEIIKLSPSAAVNSPSSRNGAHEIRIRNRLVKQAAYAYLQPTPSAIEAACRRRRFSMRRVFGAIGSCFGFFFGSCCFGFWKS